jgi:hypothetical protein
LFWFSFSIFLHLAVPSFHFFSLLLLLCFSYFRSRCFGSVVVWFGWVLASLCFLFWSTAVVLLPLRFYVLFSGELLYGSSGSGPTICSGVGLQVLFEFCTCGFLVVQWFWFWVLPPRW